MRMQTKDLLEQARDGTVLARRTVRCGEATVEAGERVNVALFFGGIEKLLDREMEVYQAPGGDVVVIGFY